MKQPAVPFHFNQAKHAIPSDCTLPALSTSIELIAMFQGANVLSQRAIVHCKIFKKTKHGVPLLLDWVPIEFPGKQFGLASFELTFPEKPIWSRCDILQRVLISAPSVHTRVSRGPSLPFRSDVCVNEYHDTAGQESLFGSHRTSLRSTSESDPSFPACNCKLHVPTSSTQESVFFQNKVDFFSGQNN